MVRRQTFGCGRDFGERLAVARAGVIHHGDVASRQTAFHFGEVSALLTEQVERFHHISLGHFLGFAFDRQPFVFGQFKFRMRLDGGGEHQRLTALELDLLDVGIADHLNVLFLERVTVSITDELALHLFLDRVAMFFEDHGDRSFANAETGDVGFLLETFLDGGERGVHGGGVQFNADEFLARSQIFDCDVHKGIVATVGN